MNEHWLDKWEREQDEKCEKRTISPIKLNHRLTRLEKSAIRNDLQKIRALIDAITQRLDSLE